MLAKKINYVNGWAKAYSNVGYCFLNESLFDSALLYFNTGLLISERSKYKHIHAELLNRKGVTFYYKGITDSSLWYFKKSLTQYEELKDSSEIIKALNNIGAISLRAGDMDGALSYFFKCLAYDEKQKSKKFIAMDCDNISVILIDKKDFASAIAYSQRALKLKTELKDTAGLLKTYLNIGSIYDGKKDYVVTEGRYTVIDVRGMEPGDLAFIYSSWLRGLRFGNPYFESMESDAYYAAKKEEISAILCQPDISVRVACASDDREVILGYIIVQLDVKSLKDKSDVKSLDSSVVWVWVRPAMRQQGVATKLAHGLRVRFVGSSTKIGDEISKKKGLTFRPPVIQWNNNKE